MRATRSPICSGASWRNSGITSTLRSDCTMAAAIAIQTVRRTIFCTSVCRSHARAAGCEAGSVAPASNMEDLLHVVGEKLAANDDGDDGGEDREDEVVVESLERREERA